MSKVSDISVDRLLQLQIADQLIIVDVRSPKEYHEGHIVGAKSLPLFTNEERARVGTTYKQVDPREALLEGLAFVGPKLRSLVEQADQYSGNKPIIGVYCWRGGARSGAVAWLLSLAGYQVHRLIGGYKAYRRSGRKLLAEMPYSLKVVDGPTGSGKTVLLSALAKLGEQVLDLEQIANHKGSAFGLTPGQTQPSSEHAENLIHHRLTGFDESRPVWIENESKNIGKVYLPDVFVKAIAAGHRVEILVPLEERIAHIVNQYGSYPSALLIKTFERLRKKLGGKATQDAKAAVADGNLAMAARIALVYYDKAYAHYTARQGHPTSEKHEVSFSELKNLAQRLLRNA